MRTTTPTQFATRKFACSKPPAPQRRPPARSRPRARMATFWSARKSSASKKSSSSPTKTSARANSSCLKTKCTPPPTGSRSSVRYSIPCLIPRPNVSPACSVCCTRSNRSTLLLMCDCRDLGIAIGERPPAPGAPTEIPAMPADALAAASANAREFFQPNLYLYDAYPGGIGFSEPLFRAHDLLIRQTRDLIAACPCDSGCPSCVGPAGDLAPRAKEAALAILDRLAH